MTGACDFPSLRRDGLTLILGLGETGVAAARWCAARGARLRVRAAGMGRMAQQHELPASSYPSLPCAAEGGRPPVPRAK